MSEQLPLFDEEIEIASFTDPDVKYTINTANKTCTCPAFTKNSKHPCKHLMSIPNLIPKPKPVTHPTLSMAMSALIKATRLRDVDDAIYWLVYLNTFPDARYRLLRRLFVMAGEDSLTLSVQNKGHLHLTNYKTATLTSMAAEVVRICKTPNFFETPDGRTWVWVQRKCEEIKAADFKPATFEMKAQQKYIEAMLANDEDDETYESHWLAMRTLDFLDPKRGFDSTKMYEWWYQLAKEYGNEEAMFQAQFCIPHGRDLSRDVNYDMQILSRLFWGTLGDQTDVVVKRGEVVDLMTKANERWKNPKPIPEHYLDGIHTVGSDRRFAGTVRAMLGQCHAYLKYGRVHPDDQWEPYFWQTPNLPLDLL